MSKERETLALKGLIELHAEAPEKQGFTLDEIAVKALTHHGAYMKHRRLINKALGWVGIHRSDKPTKAPNRFKMPVVTAGLLQLKAEGSITTESVGKIREYTNRQGEAVRDLSDSTVMYSLTEEARILSRSSIESQLSSQNGNGASPTGQVPEALITDVINTP